MGLLAIVYKFEGSRPSYEQVNERVHELEGRKVVSEIFRDATMLEKDEETRRSHPRDSRGGMLMSSTRICFRERDGNRLRLRLSVTESLDGRKLLVEGNSDRLFDVVGKVLVELGGVRGP